MSMRAIPTWRSISGRVRRFAFRTSRLFAIGALASFSAHPATDPNEKVATLGWLTGCWVEDLGPTKVVDEWVAPSRHALLGLSRTREGGSTVALELRTISDSGGMLELTTVSERGRAVLRATKYGASFIEFTDNTSRDRTVLRFTRDNSHVMELDSKRRIGARERSLNEMLDRASCADGIGQRVQPAG